MATSVYSGVCWLLEIPSELRNLIFTYVVVEANPILTFPTLQPITPPKQQALARQIHSSTHLSDAKQWLELRSGKQPWSYRWPDQFITPIYQRRLNWHLPALAETCRQFRQEALSIFYMDNTFNVTLRIDQPHRAVLHTKWFEGRHKRLIEQTADGDPCYNDYGSNARHVQFTYGIHRSNFGRLHVHLQADGAFVLEPTHGLTNICLCLPKEIASRPCVAGSMDRFLEEFIMTDGAAFVARGHGGQYHCRICEKAVTWLSIH